MKKILKSTIHYNLLFIYKKGMVFILWMLGILTFHTLYYSGYKNVSIIDIYLLSFGGVNVESLNTVQMLIAILPYIIIAIITDIYISKMMGKSALFPLVRMNKKLYFISHFLSLFIIIFVVLLIYQLLLLLIIFNFYERIPLSNNNLFTQPLFNITISFSKLISTSFLIQLLGTCAMSSMQVAITYKVKKFSVGFVFVLIVYIIQVGLPDFYCFLGQHVLLSKMNILQNDLMDILIFSSKQILLIIIIGFYCYFKKQSNIIDVTERG